jgi:hypothetical protein
MQESSSSYKDEAIPFVIYNQEEASNLLPPNSNLILQDLILTQKQPHLCQASRGL